MSPQSLNVQVALALLLFASLAWRGRAAASPPSKEAIARVQALDSAALVEEERLRGHCKQPQNPDPDGARIAERIAQIHAARIDIARGELPVGPTELVPLARQAVGAFRQSYRCDPRSRRPLDEALQLLRELRNLVPEGNAEVLASLDSAITEVETELTEYERTRPVQASTPKVVVGYLAYDGEVNPKGPIRKTYLGHLAMRFELGGGGTSIRELENRRYYSHRGVSVRLSVLARFFPGGSPRLGILFGPYFSFMTLERLENAETEWPASGSLASFGAQLELHIVPSKKFPRFSINPFLVVGMGLVSTKETTPNFAGAYGGGGLHVCFLSGTLCPVVRMLSVPRYYDNHMVTLQGGLSVDLLRIADAALTVIARKR